MNINNILDKIQRQSLRLSLCAIAIACSSVSYAQNDENSDFEEEAAVQIKQPKRKTVVDANPVCNIQGVIYDQATKLPLAGARLTVLGDKRYAAMTNAEGKFTMKVPTFATALYVQAPKHLAQQVSIKPNDESQKIVVKMITDNFATMYGDNTEITATNSFTAKGGDLVIDNEIGGNLGADIRSIQRSGTDVQGAFMAIRGLNSINANTQPLIIVDGVELDMQRSRGSLHEGDFFDMLSSISTEDIQSVKVLKNATALYGARGGNGVILIETKRGHSMATRIDFKASVGVKLIPSTPTMMNADQYRSYAVEQLGTISDVIKNQTTSGNIMNFNFLNDDPTGYYYHTYHNNTDWSDYVYRSALTQNYSINVQGGDNVGMYNLSVGYLNSDGNVKETYFDRINVRFNTDIQLLENLSTKFDMSLSRSNQYLYDDGFAEDMTLSTITSPTSLALIKSPLLSPYQYNANVKGFTSLLSEADDLYSSLGTEYSLANPVSLFENAEGERKNKNENIFFNVAIAPTWNVNKHLSATTHFSYYLNRHSQSYYRPNTGMPAFYVEGLGTVYSKYASVFAKETNILSNTHVDWSNKYGGNEFAISGGFRYNYFSYDSSDLSTQYSTKGADDKNPSLSASQKSHTVDGASDEWKNMVWYANFDYNYRNEFFTTLSLSAEANSRFGSNVSKKASIKLAGVRWGLFPGIQAGWVISNDPIFPKNSFINYLKIYGGFDVSGNDDISNYAARTTYSVIKYSTSEIGAQLTNVGNDLIKWETTRKLNFGFLTNMWNNRLSLGADFYVHKTSDLLALKAFDNPVGGINNYWTNDGSLRNVGFEVSLSVKPIETRDWHLEVGATLGHYKNKVIDLTDGDYTTSVYGDNNILTSVGNAVGVFYGYQTAGVFSTEKEASTAVIGYDYLKYKDDTGADQTFNAGDVHFVDQNGDGYIDENDKVIIGDPNPDIYGNIFATLTWKRFSMNLGFNYCVGNDVYNYQRYILNSGSTLYNQQVAELGHWRYEGQITNIPKLAYGDPKGNNRFSDRWIEDGSYLRLKTLKISYNIPIPESWQSWLQGISVWGEAQNVFTVTKYTGNDPEFSIGNSVLYQGIVAGNIAQSRAFIFGVKINL